ILQHFEHIRDVHLQEETENVRVPLQQLQFGIGKKAHTIDFAPEHLPDSLLRRPDLSLTATYRAHTIPSPDIFLDRQPCSDRFLKRSSPGHLLPGVPLTHKEQTVSMHQIDRTLKNASEQQLAHAVNQWSKLLFRIADKVARFKMLGYGHEQNAHLCDNAIVGLCEKSV